MGRVRRVRVLIYEGPKEWVETCTENKLRYVNGRREVSTRFERDEHGEPVANACVVTDKVITEHLSPIEAL
jgi:hypothetical protein